MRTGMRVIQGQLAEVEPHRTSAIEAAYQHFRLDKQGRLGTLRAICLVLELSLEEVITFG